MSYQSPKELYDSCLARERVCENIDIDRIREGIAKGLVFSPIFSNDVKRIGGSGKLDSRELEINEALLRGSKYRDLLDLLRKCKDRKGRWIILASWLRQEDVCEPEDLLPDNFNVERRLAKKGRLCAEKTLSKSRSSKSGTHTLTS
jgi:hypothetical protein